ncbi:hypothetical protein ACWT_1239 [Actinoplanes sp. SE50]|uniref:hypothetical protein n=1 Tax=unclassified Actinoplanes TaxID=2626549 RepID=UPI00023ED56C|nr:MULTISPECIES: hypothetical protein [unclassified Actinoplanes]AEV82256.1 hypothetical protein ACPL_1359 [Actinoplanes sp. SE50/110]ATO80654.1 hypothetical protein ACWT_1239 [Actinoplanes sp. SE50]SLL98061.1 hypothetical protein ACSP50_1283 [Actinoplanes sp. SE50/110]
MSDRGHAPPPPAGDAPEPDPAEPDLSRDIEISAVPAAAGPEPADTDAEPLDLTEGEPIELQAGPFSLVPVEDGDDAPLSPRRRRTRTILTGSLLAVGLLGVAGLGWYYWQIHVQRDVTLSLPPSVADMTLDDSPNAKDTADYLQTALNTEIDMDKTVGGVYSGTGEKDVLIFGGTTLIWSPGKDLATSFGLISDKQGTVTGLHDVDPGPLGGSMKCGITRTEGGNMPVCGWADHGSLALAMFPNRSESEAAPLMLQLRKAIQTRN